jgi:hypothetical protein
MPFDVGEYVNNVAGTTGAAVFAADQKDWRF